MAVTEAVTDHTFVGDNRRRCAYFHCGRPISQHLHTPATDAVNPDVVYVLLMDWNNTQSYSEGYEITVHHSRRAAVKEILTTVHALGLGEGLVGDPEGNDPETNDTGGYFVDYEGRLEFRIERSEIGEPS